MWTHTCHSVPADECTEVQKKQKQQRSSARKYHRITCMLTVNETDSSRAEALCFEDLKELV